MGNQTLDMEISKKTHLFCREASETGEKNKKKKLVMALDVIGDVFGIIKSCVRGIRNGDTQERVYINIGRSERSCSDNIWLSPIPHRTTQEVSGHLCLLYHYYCSLYF